MKPSNDFEFSTYAHYLLGNEWSDDIASVFKDCPKRVWISLPQVEVEGARDLQEVQGVQAEVTADAAEGDGAPRRSNRLRVRTLACGGSLEYPPTNFPVQPVLSGAYTT